MELPRLEVWGRASRSASTPTVGPRAVPGAQETEFDRVFDLGGTPGRYLNSAAADDASATTLAAAANLPCARDLLEKT